MCSSDLPPPMLALPLPLLTALAHPAALPTHHHARAAALVRPAGAAHAGLLASAHTSRTSGAVMDFSGPKYKMDAKEGEVAEVPFEVRFSIGNLVTGSGALLLVYCLSSYLINNGQVDLVATLGFVYAIPALVGGLALKYAELPPVPLDTSAAAEAAREAKATTIQAKILSDATRFTYGDAHMEDPLKALKLAPRGMGPPELVALGEEVASTGGYALKMQFFAPNTPYRVWKDRAPRYSRFFGPGVRAELKLVSVEKKLVELSLITVEEGEPDEPLEVMPDGTRRIVLTAAAEEEAAASS